MYLQNIKQIDTNVILGEYCKNYYLWIKTSSNHYYYKYQNYSIGTNYLDGYTQVVSVNLFFEDNVILIINKTLLNTKYTVVKDNKNLMLGNIDYSKINLNKSSNCAVNTLIDFLY